MIESSCGPDAETPRTESVVRAFGTGSLFLLEAAEQLAEGRDDCRIVLVDAIGVHFGQGCQRKKVPDTF